MRLSPIERPDSLMLKWVYRLSRKRLGKVISPMKVVYARVPKSLRMAYEISKLTEGGFTLDPALRFLLQTHTAALNDCAFCVDIARAIAMRGRMGLDQVNALPTFRESDLFSERERAALEYVEETTQHKRVADATFNRLNEHFSDVEIAEITLLNAIENFYNLVNIPLEIESDALCSLVDHPAGRALSEAQTH